MSTTDPSAESWDLRAPLRPFIEESKAWTWWSVLSTTALLVLGVSWTVVLTWWPLRLVACLFTALLLVRMFILFHDFCHGAIMRKSALGRRYMHFFGMVTMTPQRAWRASHDFHHAHVGRPEFSHVGAFQILTVDQWAQMNWRQRLVHKIYRSPATLIFAYFTVFFANVTVAPFLRDPKKHWDALPTLALHAAMILTVFYFLGLQGFFFVYFIPMAIASAIGAYLFWVQHNYEGMEILPENRWNKAEASIKGSSYLKLGPILRYFTGNIGFHHVHHANHAIPFYRLREAMEKVPQLQQVTTITLSPRQIWVSLRIHLWDERLGRMVTYGEAAKG